MNTRNFRSKLFLSVSLALAPLAFATQSFAEDSPRSVGTMIDDATITTTVKAKLLQDERTDAFDINVDTEAGTVTLRGGADNAQAKAAAEAIAGQVEGVRSVNNLIVVAAEGSLARTEANTATVSGELRKGANEAAAEANEGIITTKVKSQLLAASDINGSDIEVETEGSVVHLAGEVPSREMKARAIALAESTRGVSSVDASQLKIRGS